MSMVDPSDFIEHGLVSTCCQAELAGGCCMECGEQDDGEEENPEEESEPVPAKPTTPPENS